MNYIGSKFSLLKEISAVLKRMGVPESGVAVDVFSGTGAVSQLLKLRGHLVLANDWQYYAYITTYAYVGLNGYPSFKNLMADEKWEKKIKATKTTPLKSYSVDRRHIIKSRKPFFFVLNYLNQLKGKTGKFSKEYCEGGEGGRQYFSKQNGRRIQAVRDQIEHWHDKKLIGKNEKYWLIACLIESADRVANTASVYAAFLKHIKKTAQKPLELFAINPTIMPTPRKHQVTCQNGENFVQSFNGQPIELTYIDPPYNHRQYSSNYHLLETITRWDLDGFEPRGKTGLRPQKELRSEYCNRRNAVDAFDRLLGSVKSNHVLFSYNSEGLLGEKTLMTLFKRHFKEVKLNKLNYQRFKSDKVHEKRRYSASKTTEFLVFAKGPLKMEKTVATH